ncbi:alpha/beta hydrolase [Hymenobacter terrestris]|uniref:Alpha/beta fold hydrolase n=1 Tax=Hymenobacter terrestris TaxID=2748310 RepID=A0ABX2Q4A7_9BACT|nr:alpha/beta fold hydrolase [Hymenobacter terrestris]NVO85112.1 alpha/beta fold hydrolase [Hymenobacter terrestris]
MRISVSCSKVLLTLLLLLLVLPAWALKPDRVYHQTPDSLGLAYTTRTVTTADGYQLKSWEIAPAAQAAKPVAVVLAYQDFGNMSYFLHQARALSRAGYAVVLFDYRGFGQSADFPINPSQLYYEEFAADLRAVVQATRQRLPKSKVGVLSLSMGTIVAATVAAERRLDFLITEGLMANPAELASKVKQLKNKDVLLPADAASYPQRWTKVKCPMLLFGGTQDAFTPLADSEQLAGKRPRRTLVSFEGGHLGGFPTLSSQPDSYDNFGDLYVQHISAFLTKAGIQ